MRGGLRVVVDGDRVVELYMVVLLVVKVCYGVDGFEVMIVGSVVSLFEGDELVVELVFGWGAWLIVMSVVVQLVYFCLGGGWIGVVVWVELVVGVWFDWWLELMVVCGGGCCWVSLLWLWLCWCGLWLLWLCAVWLIVMIFGG